MSRAYYHCRGCRQSQIPWDAEVGLTKRGFTPAATEIITLAGTLGSFAEAAERTLVKMSALRVSESTVERTTEDTGERLGKLLAAKATFGRHRVWEWQRDAHGRTCGYASVDATGVRQQGPRGAQAEGRMAYNAMIYNADSASDSRHCPPHQVRYLAGFYGLDELGLQLRRQAAQVGWDDVDQQIALTDGGSGLEEFMRRNFPKAQCILDFFHASEHAANLARALHPTDEAACGRQIQAWCHRLKHEGGAALLAEWEQVDLTGRSAAVLEVFRLETQYVRGNLHRMDYPTYLANGWQIGSGPIEAACKHVVGQRLKCSGMRWSEVGADAVCHLRALYLSETGQWESFWSAHPR